MKKDNIKAKQIYDKYKKDLPIYVPEWDDAPEEVKDNFRKIASDPSVKSSK